MKKMHSCRGETLVESLCAILVLTVVFLFLCGAVVSAARSNAQIKGADQSFRSEDREATNTEKYLVVNGNKYPIPEWVTKTKSTYTGYATAIYRRYTTQEAAK